jgi:predicted O-methyltransferase YrrM
MISHNHTPIIPRWIRESAWTSHIPIADHIVKSLRPDNIVELGTHYGVSCFAFAQSVRESQIDCSVFAIDLWTGDLHTGPYAEHVYSEVANHACEEYRDIVYTLRLDFNEAVNYFKDGAIDIIHIDGLHTYEAVKNDFETWISKLAPNGIVLFHDTNVREREFGVHRLLDELMQTSNYKIFEIKSGHGLGILCYKDSGTACRVISEIEEQSHVLKALGRLYEKLFDAQLSLDARIKEIGTLEAARIKEISTLEAANRLCEAETQALRRSFSWRITKPLRAISRRTLRRP